ncbi:MAG: hypothetical protein ACRCU2_24270, partial [Planktothrix sp.]
MKRIQRYCLLFLDILKDLGSALTNPRIYKPQGRTLPMVLFSLVVIGLWGSSLVNWEQLSFVRPVLSEPVPLSQEQLIRSINGNNPITTMEKKWELDYETYFSRNLTDSQLQAPDIAKILTEISQKTQTKHAVL